MTILQPTSAAGSTAGESWHDVCGLDRLTVERGAAALVEGQPVALFRLDEDEVVAIDDIDPFWGVPVLSRGLVGSNSGRDTVASPLLKQRFDLRTGDCLDDPTVTLAVWPVRVHEGRVAVSCPPPLLQGR